jgi:hypothetical protein
LSNNKEFNIFLENEILSVNFREQNNKTFIQKFSNKLQDKFANVIANETIENIIDTIKDTDITNLWS